MLPTAGPSFDREYGCSLAEWRRWMPEAVHGHPFELERDALVVRIGGGALHVAWTELEPRRIALAVLPRLAVRFRFEGVDDAARQAFQRRFDLHLQRGGG